MRQRSSMVDSARASITWRTEFCSSCHLLTSWHICLLFLPRSCYVPCVHRPWQMAPVPGTVSPSLRSITPHRPADLREASHDRWLWTVLLFFNPHNATSLFFIMSTPCLPLNPLVLVLNDCISQKVISMYLFLLHFIFRAWHLEMFHIKIYWCSLTAQRVLSLLWL